LATEFITYVINQRLIEVANFQAAASAQGLANPQNQLASQFGLLDSLTVLEPASPGHKILPRIRETVIVAIVAGASMSIMLILLLNSLRDTIGNPEVLSRRFGITSLGTLFRWSTKVVNENDIIVSKLPSSSYSEAFRQFRTNLQFAIADRPSKFLLVTSPGPSEGKTTVLCNLASAIAQTGKRVIIVDCDLRRPAIHRRFRLQTKEPGVSSFLAQSNININDVLLATAEEQISVVPAGPIPPNPSELLGSSRMGELLQQLGTLADVVLLDSPPVLVVADTAVIAAQSDGVIVVGDGQSTKAKSLRATLDILAQTQVHILGMVINKLTHRRFDYGYGYGYGYGYEYTLDEIDTGADTMANGRQPAYRRPLLWARSALSKLPRSKDRN
jgi:non-specific protein-tyrosine kinase